MGLKVNGIEFHASVKTTVISSLDNFEMHSVFISVHHVSLFLFLDRFQ